MLSQFKQNLQKDLLKALQGAFPGQAQDLPSLELEIPADSQHGDYSTNIALKSAKTFRKSPMDIAADFLPVFEKFAQKKKYKSTIAKIEVKSPGFINFYLSSELVCQIVEDIFKQGDKFGRLDFGQKKKVQIEFVSANPTGPLSVAHARQAAVGDALVNILNFIGFKAEREYYINDGGNQINILGKSIKSRSCEILGENVTFPEEGYQGEYIKEMAQIFMDKHSVKSLDDLNKLDEGKFTKFGVEYLLNVIKTDLDDFGVHFDIWSHESKIADRDAIEKVLKLLDKKGYLYEKDGALWFKSTDFGDDKDRVVKKSDGSYTYLSPDIVYHKNKYDRKFNQVINIWGPDHHGYIPRIKAAVEALGQDRSALEVLIVQLATIYRDGKPVSMSTRRGEFISLREVIDEVGVDAARFFFLMRHIKAHLDFDLELAKKETSENPVYYIQYAHARIYSINAKAEDQKISEKKKNFDLLTSDEEMTLIKKLASFSDMLLLCHKELDPYALVSYLQELATAFHKFYDRQRVIDDSNKELSSQRLGLTNATRIVLANGLRLLGVSTPEKM